MKEQRHSLQASHLSVEGIGDCWVRLDSGRASAALEVDGIPFGLLSDAEQDSAVTAYAAFLQGLEQPLQIIVRLLPADLQRQLEELDAQAQRLPAALAPFAHSHRAFLHDLAQRGGLLERHHYLVIANESSPTAPVHLLQRWRRGGPAMTERSMVDLSARLEALVGGLRRCNLGSRRLSGYELAALLYACWCPERSRRQRLVADLEEVLPSLIVAEASERSGT
jgi:hypothetical protein